MIQHSWEASLDALEARLARQEAALSQGMLDGGFDAVALPSTSLSERDRVRAQLALDRVRRLEAELRQRQHAMTTPGRQSPYC